MRSGCIKDNTLKEKVSNSLEGQFPSELLLLSSSIWRLEFAFKHLLRDETGGPDHRGLLPGRQKKKTGILCEEAVHFGHFYYLTVPPTGTPPEAHRSLLDPVI